MRDSRFSRCTAILIIMTAWLVACSRNEPPAPWPDPSPPGKTSAVFAPGIVSTGAEERDLAVTPAGDEIFFSRSVVRGEWMIMTCRRVDGKWSAPEVAPFSTAPGVNDIEPFVSPDGSRLYFVSDRPTDSGDKGGNWDIWYVERQDSQWGPPTNPGSPLNTEEGEFFPAVTGEGHVYFCRADPETRRNYIFRSARTSDGFAPPVKVPGPPNDSPNQFNTYVSPDESMMILSVAGREDSRGGSDYYISFRESRGEWSTLVPFPAVINSASPREWSPFLSPDVKVFFFMSSRGRSREVRPGQPVSRADLEAYADGIENGGSDIYWISAEFISSLRLSAQSNPLNASNREVSK